MAVHDDENGIALPVVTGHGLENMRDHLGAVGGTVNIEAPPVGGTVVAVSASRSPAGEGQ